MEIHDNKYTVTKIPHFWDRSYKQLPYQRYAFNNRRDEIQWRKKGYDNKNFTGLMYDSRNTMPTWTKEFLTHFQNWNNVQLSFYKMETSNILPVHSDTYEKYRSLFLHNQQDYDIYRAVIFLEDWQSGHYFEIDNMPITNWSAGTTVTWKNDVRHMAANIGETNRYTLQVTGWKKIEQ